jgi:drug/metabolite transporter (DMT)-like permease
MSDASEPRPAAGLAAAGMAVTLWGTTSVLIKQVDGITPLAVACYRVWLGAAMVTIVHLARGGGISLRLLRQCFLGGLAFAADLILFFYAVNHTSVANASVIGALQPVLVVLVSARLFGEHPVRSEILWGLVAIVGVVLVVMGGDGGRENGTAGNLLAVGALIAWTGYFVATKHARQGLTSLEYIVGMSLVAALLTLPLPLLVPGTLANTDASGWVIVLALTLLNGVIAHQLAIWAHGHISLLTMSLMTLAIPVGAAAAGAVFIDEPLTPVQLGGMAVVLASLALVTMASARRSPEEIDAELDAVGATP